MSRKWDAEEEKLLIDNIGKVSKDEILEMFPNRTWKALQHKYKKLGFKFKNNYEPIPENELFKIINGLKHMKCKSCRRYLPFEFLYFPKDDQCKLGYRSICKECKGENFALKEVVWTEEESNIIQETYHTMTNREIQSIFLPDKTIEQISHKGNVLGLRKNEDVSLRARLESYTIEWRNKISQTHKEKGYSVGKNNPMYGTSRKGSENPNWQGGISQLYEHLRRNIKEWKIASMKDCNYKCVITGESFDDIHHLYSFKSIVYDTLNNLSLPVKEYVRDYTEEEIKSIETECLRIHMNLLGVCLRGDVHSLFHSIYTNKNFTKEDFHEFKERYANGEFEGLLEKVV